MRLIAAQWFGLWTTPTLKRLGALGMAAGLALAVSFLGVRDLDAATASELRAAATNASLCGLVMLLAGAVASTAEYRHGTLANSVLLVGARWRLLVAHALALALAATLIGATCALGVIVFLSGLSAAGGGHSLGLSEAVRLIAGVAGYSGLAAMFGAGFGSAIRSQTVAVAAALVLFLGVEPVLASLSGEVGTWGLTGAAAGMIGTESAELSWPVATAVFAAYASVALLIGMASLQRRDLG